MMISKRATAILLIVFGVLMIAGLLYWTFAPPLKRAPTISSTSLPDPIPPRDAPSPLLDSFALPTPSSSVTNEDQEQLVVRQRAQQIAARQGSYTNTDDFVSLQTVYVDVTPTVKAFYEEERHRLTRAHPLSSGAWTQTMRALSSRITSNGSLVGASEVVVVVQAQQIIEEEGEPAKIAYQEITFLFTRDGGRWMVSRVVARPLEL